MVNFCTATRRKARLGYALRNQNTIDFCDCLKFSVLYSCIELLINININLINDSQTTYKKSQNQRALLSWLAQTCAHLQWLKVCTFDSFCVRVDTPSCSHS